jgi:membrane-associated phospholipid phosphatase
MRPETVRHDVWLIVRRALGLAMLVTSVTCGESPVEPRIDREVDAGAWKTWVIANGASLRPPPPPAPGSAQAVAEIADILAIQRTRTAAMDSAIQRWSGLPTAPWHALALDRLEVYWVLLPDVRLATPVRSARIMALLNVAMYDALVAAWDAKHFYQRGAPAEEDHRVQVLVDDRGLSSYPSEHAAVAAAAATMLSYLFPKEDTLSFRALEREVGGARIAAGVARRSDVDAGYLIGRAVATQVLARAKADGADVEWSGPVPTGSGVWRPTPNKYVQLPFDGSAGQWRTWLLPTGSAFRPAPPPALTSAQYEHDLDELRLLSAGRSLEQANSARYWATDAPSGKWEGFMRDEIARRHLAPVHAARALALSSVAMYDAFVACWDAKFHYWLLRPISADPTAIRPVFPTPPFPSYPSGHSTISTAAAEVFAELFPDAAATYRAKARDASLSRVYAGVHYRFDVDTGDVLGEKVGQLVVDYMRHDGASR